MPTGLSAFPRVCDDQFAAGGLNAGGEVWFSVMGGLLPDASMAIIRAAIDGRHDEATAHPISFVLCGLLWPKSGRRATR